jgi:hypothetical protein
MGELPEVRWSTAVTSLMDRREQLRRYQEAVSLETAQRQVRLHREELGAARARARPKVGS